MQSVAYGMSLQRGVLTQEFVHIFSSSSSSEARDKLNNEKTGAAIGGFGDAVGAETDESRDRRTISRL
jgi:hypothetical protein